MKKAKTDKFKVAVIIPWRKGETELESTKESAIQSIGKGATIIAIEDKLGDGPAMTRHRGIEAASDCDVIVIVDAHMKFKGDVLKQMAMKVAKNGGLLCARCYHNEGCRMDDGTSGYLGADIHMKGVDQNGNQAIMWKWSADKNPGKRACVGGACYVFRRDWYYQTGQCLSALPAWGCDEEALSITAWLSGHEPEVFDGDVAHRWRAKAPWNGAARAINTSRAAMICALVVDPAERADLLAYQGVQPIESMEVKRWRNALLRQPRTWGEWKDIVPVKPIKREPAKCRANYGAMETNRICKCGSSVSTVDKTRITGRIVLRYRICECGMRRVSREELKQ